MTFTKLMNQLDFYRLGMLAGTFLIQGCITVPILIVTMYASAGFDLFQVSVLTISSFAILVVNLSVLPAKVVFPIFMGATVFQIGLILYNLMMLL